MSRRTRRAVVGALGAGALAGLYGCLQVFSEATSGRGCEGEDWGTVSAHPFAASAAARSSVATVGGADWPDSFGQAVATTGDTVFVGVPQAPVDGADKAGLVAVFDRVRGEWERTATVTGRAKSRDYFGGQLAASGSTLLVGNEYNYSGTSRIPVSVFEQSKGGAWELRTTLTDSVYVESMAVATGTAVVRTDDDDDLARVYERATGTWTQRETLAADNRNEGRFVRTVATDGQTILVGTPPKSGPNCRRAKSGVVHAFERSGDTWRHSQALSGAPGKDHFGWSVSVADGRAVIGDYTNDTAYVFGRSDDRWSREQMYTATDGESHQYFGDTVATDGTTVLVAAPHAPFGDTAGAIYDLHLSSTDDSDVRYFTAPDSSERFGAAMATAGGTSVATLRRSDENFVSIYER
jgi:hypothetical protein